MLAVAAMVLVIVAAGCGPKADPPTSIMDSPENHYNQGLKASDTDRREKAMRGSDRTISLIRSRRPAILAEVSCFSKKVNSKVRIKQREGKTLPLLPLPDRARINGIPSSPELLTSTFFKIS